MGILGTLFLRQEHFRRGGNEILCMEVLSPGNMPGNGVQNAHATPEPSVAARQYAALAGALEDFVRKRLLPQAEAELEAAVAAGQGYRFSPYRCRIHCEERAVRRVGASAPVADGVAGTAADTVAVTLRFLVTSGGILRHEAVLSDDWTTDGCLRLPPRGRSGRRRRFLRECKNS